MLRKFQMLNRFSMVMVLSTALAPVLLGLLLDNGVLFDIYMQLAVR